MTGYESEFQLKSSIKCFHFQNIIKKVKGKGQFLYRFVKFPENFSKSQISVPPFAFITHNGQKTITDPETIRRDTEFEIIVKDGVDKCVNSLVIPAFLQYKSTDLTNQIRELLSRAAYETECKRQWDVRQDKNDVEVEVISLDDTVKNEPFDE